MREVNLSLRESANLTIRECVIYWEKSRIPTKASPNCVKKLCDLYESWRNLQKNLNKIGDVLKQREEQFVANLDCLFDIAHASALTIIKIEEDRDFLRKQREPGRIGYMAGVERKLAQKEDRSQQRARVEEEKRLNYASISSSPVLGNNSMESDSSICSTEFTPSPAEKISLPKDLKRGTKNFITAKLVSALDRCQLSTRNAVYILGATIEALGKNIENYAINKSSIQRIRIQNRKHRAEHIKQNFKSNVPQVVSIHWDGKLLPAINITNTKEERLPIVITYGKREQLIAVPKLKKYTGCVQNTAANVKR